MRIDVVSLFPEMFTPVQTSIPRRAQEAGLWQLHLHQLRDYAPGKHRQVDDTPYGGGAGMVMGCPPWFHAVRSVQQQASESAWVVHMSPQGPPLNQEEVRRLAARPRLMLLCGHYEGVDERVVEGLVDQEVCVGDFVVSGGELPAMMLIDAVVRCLPGAIKAESLEADSFYHGLLDHPHYTRPPEWEGRSVPPVLLSGNHAEIERWRRLQALERTRVRRPDLLKEIHEEPIRAAGNRPATRLND